MSGPYVIYFITRFLSVKFYETCSVHPLTKVMIIVQTLPQSTSLAISLPTINLSKNLKNIFSKYLKFFIQQCLGRKFLTSRTLTSSYYEIQVQPQSMKKIF